MSKISHNLRFLVMSQKMPKIFSKFYIDTSILPTFFDNIFVF